jgi:preprotein translocase subunit SecF
MTVGTVIMALIALYFFGGEVIRGFTFAMLFGVIVGTYSSVFIAAPFLILVGVKRDWSGLDKAKTGTPSRAKGEGVRSGAEPVRSAPIPEIATEEAMAPADALAKSAPLQQPKVAAMSGGNARGGGPAKPSSPRRHKSGGGRSKRRG